MLESLGRPRVVVDLASNELVGEDISQLAQMVGRPRAGAKTEVTYDRADVPADPGEPQCFAFRLSDQLDDRERPAERPEERQLPKLLGQRPVIDPPVVVAVHDRPLVERDDTEEHEYLGPSKRGSRVTADQRLAPVRE